MGLEDLSTLDETFPKGNIETVSTLDNYQRETRAKLKAWADVEHDLATGNHMISALPIVPPAVGKLYYDKITGELRYYTSGPASVPGSPFWRSVIQPPFNYVYNPEFLLMSNGVNSAPCGWTWSAAAGQNITQDTFNTNLGKYSIVLTTSADNVNASVLAQSLSTSNPRFLPIDYWRGRTISFGCYVLSSLANKAFIQLNDGVQTVNSAVQDFGGAGWQWLTCSMVVSAGATNITVRLVGNPHTSIYNSYFSMPTLVEGAWCTRPNPQEHPQRSYILPFTTYNAAAQPMNITAFYGPTGRSTNAFLVSVTIPYRFQARNLTVNSNVAPGVGQTIDFVIIQNSGTLTNIACQLAGSAIVATDDTHTFMGNANDTLCLRTIGSVSPVAGIYSATLYVDELPW